MHFLQKMKLRSEFALQQIIQIIAQTYRARIDKDLQPITIGRLKNRFIGPEGEYHLTTLNKMFREYPDDYHIIVDKGGYIAVYPPNGILASRIKI